MVAAAFVATLFASALTLNQGAVAGVFDDTSVFVQKSGIETKQEEGSGSKFEKAIFAMKSGIEKFKRAAEELMETADTFVSVARSVHKEEVEATQGPLVSLLAIRQVPGEQQQSPGEQQAPAERPVSEQLSNMQDQVGKSMSEANSALEGVHNGTSEVIEKIKAAGRTAVLPAMAKMEKMVNRMKGNMQLFAHSLHKSFEKANKVVVSHLSDVVREHVRLELENAKNGEPASLLQLEEDASAHGSRGKKTARAALVALHASAERALEGLEDIATLASEELAAHDDAATQMQVEEVMRKTEAAIDDMGAEVRTFSEGVMEGFKIISDNLTDWVPAPGTPLAGLP